MTAVIPTFVKINTPLLYRPSCANGAIKNDLNDLIISELIIGNTKISREEKQLMAKVELTKIMSPVYTQDEIDRILDEELREMQYLFTLGFIESMILKPTSNTDKRSLVLSALMNGGKSTVVTKLFFVLFDLNRHYKFVDFDCLMITCYKKEVTDQFKKDILNIDVMNFVSEFYKGVSMSIVANGIKTLITPEVDCVKKIKARTLAKHNKVKRMCVEAEIPFNTELIVITNLHPTCREISKNNYDELVKTVENRSIIALCDEFHSATSLDINGEYLYYDVNGHKNPDYKGTLYSSLKKFPNIKRIIGMTGTPTVAHIKDTDNFKMVDSLIIKEEIKKYTKFVEVKFSDSENDRLDWLVGRVFFNDKLYPQRKGTAIIQITNDTDNNPNELTLQQIELALKKKGYDINKHALLHFGDNMDSIKDVVDAMERWDSPIKFLIIKNAFSAGVNVKNIIAFTTLKQKLAAKVLKDKLYHNPLQTLLRCPRGNFGVENNGNSRDDITSKMGEFLNTVIFFLPMCYIDVMQEMDRNVVSVKVIN